MMTRVSRPSSALAALSAAEKATVLDELLATRPDLRELAETHAARFLSAEDRIVVAAQFADTLRGLDIEELNGRAGHQRGSCQARDRRRPSGRRSTGGPATTTERFVLWFTRTTNAQVKGLAGVRARAATRGYRSQVGSAIGDSRFQSRYCCHLNQTPAKVYIRRHEQHRVPS